MSIYAHGLSGFLMHISLQIVYPTITIEMISQKIIIRPFFSALLSISYTCETSEDSTAGNRDLSIAKKQHADSHKKGRLWHSSVINGLKKNVTECREG
jgi:hypothetical protein